VTPGGDGMWDARRHTAATVLSRKEGKDVTFYYSHALEIAFRFLYNT